MENVKIMRNGSYLMTLTSDEIRIKADEPQLYYITSFSFNKQSYPTGMATIPLNRIIMAGTAGEGVSICARTSRLCTDCGGRSVKLVSTNLATKSGW